MARNFSDLDLANANAVVLEELQKVTGPTKTSSTNVYIICPFHNDTDPSCSVYVVHGGRFPVGTFNCLGCGESGSWNKLAEQLGLRRLSRDDLTDTRTPVLSDRAKQMQRARVGLVDRPGTEMPPGVPYPWDEWRDISGNTVRAAGGRLCKETVSGYRVTNLYLPVIAAGRVPELAFVIRARLEKHDDYPSYVNSENAQTQTKGLFPYPLARKMLATGRYGMLALVEGPRDALRLIDNGIPALAILGTSQWSEDKRLDVAALCHEHRAGLLLLMDGDDAGIKARREIVASYRGDASSPRVRTIKLEDYGEDLDPGNIPERMLRKIAKSVKSRSN